MSLLKCDYVSLALSQLGLVWPLLATRNWPPASPKPPVSSLQSPAAGQRPTATRRQSLAAVRASAARTETPAARRWRGAGGRQRAASEQRGSAGEREGGRWRPLASSPAGQLSSSPAAAHCKAPGPAQQVLAGPTGQQVCARSLAARSLASPCRLAALPNCDEWPPLERRPPAKQDATSSMNLGAAQ